MEYVLEMGCDVNAANALGETPLHLAAGMHFEGKIQFDLCSFPKPRNILFLILNIKLPPTQSLTGRTSSGSCWRRARTSARARGGATRRRTTRRSRGRRRCSTSCAPRAPPSSRTRTTPRTGRFDSQCPSIQVLRGSPS